MLMMTMSNVFFYDGGDKSSDVLQARSIAQMDKKDNIMLLFFFSEIIAFLFVISVFTGRADQYMTQSQEILCVDSQGRRHT